MDYNSIAMLENLKRQEAITEHWVEFTPRTFTIDNAIRVVRLPNYIWAHFDMMVHYNIITADEVFEDSQLGCDVQFPARSFEDNLIVYILAASSSFAKFYN